MSWFGSFLKSPVGKLHSSYVLFILLNLLTGLVNLFIQYTPWLVTIHFYTGLLIVLAPLTYLAVSRNRRMILKAFGKMVLPNKADIQKKKFSAFIFKLAALVIALLTIVNALSGVFMKFQLLLPAVSYDIHVFNFKILLVVIPLHAIMVFAMHRSHKKPINAQGKPKGTSVPKV